MLLLAAIPTHHAVFSRHAPNAFPAFPPSPHSQSPTSSHPNLPSPYLHWLPYRICSIFHPLCSVWQIRGPSPRSPYMLCFLSMMPAVGLITYFKPAGEVGAQSLL